MAVRYDSRADRLSLAVTDLVRTRRAASPLAGGRRSELGRRAHVLHGERRAAREQSYRPEVRIRHEFPLGGATVAVSGRIDGVWEEDETVVLEEVKLRPLEAPELPLPGDLEQLTWYLWLWRNVHGSRKPAAGVLTYLDPLAGTVEAFPHDPDPADGEAAESDLRERLTGILRQTRAESRRIKRLSETTDQLRWPFDSVRPLQERMRSAVRETLRGRRTLLLEAPTGSGKTAPILLAALAEALRSGARLAFATSRTAQQEDRLELLARALPVDARVRVLLLGSRARLDEEDGPAGLEIAGIDAHDPPDWFIRWLDTAGAITPEDTAEAAGERGIGAHVLQRAAIGACDVVIGDMNLVVNPLRPLPGWFDPARHARPTILLIDEVHSLADRLRDRLAGRISLPGLVRLAETANRANHPIAGEALSALGELAERLEARLETLADEGTAFALFDPDDPDFAETLARTAHVLPPLIDTTGADETANLARRLANAARSSAEPSGCAAYFDCSARAAHWESIDTASLLRHFWQRCEAAIGFSGTLSPLRLTAEELGLSGERCDLLQLSAPEPAGRRLVLRATGIETTWRRRDNSLGELCSLLSGAAAATGGAWLVFFPSRSYLELAAAGLERRHVPHTVLATGLTQQMLRFLDQGEGARLHLAVLGGKYAEGFDPPVGFYDGAAVVSIGIPPPNARSELINLFSEETAPLSGSYLVPGLRRVQQAAGRLFRSEEQDGVLLLIDSRFAAPAVESLLADEWRESEPLATCEQVLARIARWAAECAGM